MSLVKRDEISLGNSSLESINFSLKGKQKNAVQEPYDNEGKGLSAYEFYRLVLKSILLARKRKENHAACVLVICCLTTLSTAR